MPLIREELNPLVFHFVQSGNSATFRCGYLINLVFRMGTFLKEQFRQRP